MPPSNDSSCTETPDPFAAGKIGVLTFDVTFDSGDGSFTSHTVTTVLEGYLLALETNPGLVAPQINYDITMTDAQDYDVLEGAGADRSATASQKAAIASGTYFHPAVSRQDRLTLVISGNNVLSATTKIIVYYEQAARL